MATSKKTPYAVTLSTATDALVLQLDPDIYTAAVLTETGLTVLSPAMTKRIPSTIKQTTSSSFAGLLKATVSRGVGNDEESRIVEIVCETAKLDTAKIELVGKIVNLGYGATVSPWTITKVR